MKIKNVLFALVVLLLPRIYSAQAPTQPDTVNEDIEALAESTATTSLEDRGVSHSSTSAIPAAPIIPTPPFGSPTAAQPAHNLVIPAQAGKLLMKNLVEQAPTNSTFGALKLALDTATHPVVNIHAQGTIPQNLGLTLEYNNQTFSAPFNLTPTEITAFVNAYSALQTSVTSNPSTPISTNPITPTKKGGGDDEEDDTNKKEARERLVPYNYPYDRNEPQAQNPSTPMAAAAPAPGTTPSAMGNFHNPAHHAPSYGPSHSYTSGNAPREIPHGAVGQSLAQQTGFGASKPSFVVSPYATAEQVKKLSFEPESVTVVPRIDSEISTSSYRPKTVSLTPEPLYHQRLTESSKRLVIAPVSEDPSPQTPSDSKEIVNKKPVSLFKSLWNTVSKPLITVMSWFLAFFNRK